MRYMELDGVRYEVACCEKCPFFNDGAGYEYLHFCQHPKSPYEACLCMEIPEAETHLRCDRNCPLREV